MFRILKQENAISFFNFTFISMTCHTFIIICTLAHQDGFESLFISFLVFTNLLSLSSVQLLQSVMKWLNRKRSKALHHSIQETTPYGITDSLDMSLSRLQEMVKDREDACCSPWGHKEQDMTEQQNNSQQSHRCNRK